MSLDVFGFDEAIDKIVQLPGRIHRQADKAVGMPYWTIPDDAYDDPDQMAHWVRLAYAAALRSPPKTPKKAKKAPL